METIIRFIATFSAVASIFTANLLGNAQSGSSAAYLSLAFLGFAGIFCYFTLVREE